MSMPVLVVLAHARMLHHATNALGVTSSGYAAAQISGSTLLGIASAVFAAVTLALGVAVNNSKKLAAAQQQGRASRDEEVARLTQWMEFYRQNYAMLLQERAGVPQAILPPQSTVVPPPPGPPPPPAPTGGNP